MCSSFLKKFPKTSGWVGLWSRPLRPQFPFSFVLRRAKIFLILNLLIFRMGGKFIWNKKNSTGPKLLLFRSTGTNCLVPVGSVKRKSVFFMLGLFVCCYCCWLCHSLSSDEWRQQLTAPPRNTETLFKFHYNVFASGNRFRFFHLFISVFFHSSFDFFNGELWPANVGAWNFCFCFTSRFEMKMICRSQLCDGVEMSKTCPSYSFPLGLRQFCVRLLQRSLNSQRWDVGRFFPWH